MFRIDYDGVWYDEEEQIHRKTLVKLLSDKALMVDGHGRYWLKSPHEKYQVDVEDVPYVIIDYALRREGTPEQDLRLKTNMDEFVLASPTHKLTVRPESRKGQE